MDIFAHGLWSYAIFHRKKYALPATLFGVLPDILSFGILFVINLLNGNFHRGPPAIDALPRWLFAAYNLTHSLVMFILVFTAIYLITKKWFWPLSAWALHIIIDIPSHSTRYFPTPFLWPLSDYVFNGISWATLWFLILNYSALMIVYILIAHYKAKENKLTTRFKK